MLEGMIKRTTELQPGDHIIMPAQIIGGQAEKVKVRAVRPYIPGIMDQRARAAGHNRLIFFERAPRPGQSEGACKDIPVPAEATWTLA